MTRRYVPVLEGQHGLVTRSQLLDAGWGYASIRRWALRLGNEVAPGVYATSPLLTPSVPAPVRPRKGFDVDRERLRLIRAAALWAGPNCYLTASGGLELRGYIRPRDGVPLRFLTPSPARVRAFELATLVRTRRVWPPLDEVGGVDVAPVARCLVDAGRHREYSRTGLRALAIRLLQRRWVTPDALQAELAAGRRNDTRAIRQGLRDFRRGAWSLPEARLHEIVCGAGLGPILLNPELQTLTGGFIGVPDGYFPRAGVAVQVHSREFHDGDDADGNDQWEATVAHDADYVAHGILPIGVAPTALNDRPDRFLTQVRAAIAYGSRRPLPEVVVIPRKAA